MSEVTIIDESMLGQKRSWHLELLDETLTLRELIRRRIYQEVTEFNAKQALSFQGLVQPNETERTLNGYRLQHAHKLGWQAQYEKAIEAFSRRGFIVLVNDRQVENLDASIALPAGSEVTFFKLVPLVGG
ncbi:MoaD/ThiS family protein [Ktedonobacter robiniae]|uniref:Uncharacterized protein n=1 Tax=Ktedonobacter robiniae TaxID=2778365 RepID=A0ABQ3V1Z9_9CHLR|nr:MoaD/ThiS family protein [Ktedonobacter robiniae]GHO59003.1 hypothetical protein KSB_74780 [Ktedonobacter robiniae]